MDTFFKCTNFDSQKLFSAIKCTLFNLYIRNFVFILSWTYLTSKTILNILEPKPKIWVNWIILLICSQSSPFNSWIQIVLIVLDLFESRALIRIWLDLLAFDTGTLLLYIVKIKWITYTLRPLSIIYYEGSANMVKKRLTE